MLLFFSRRNGVSVRSQIQKSLQSWSASFTVKALPTHFAKSGNAFKQAVDKNMQAIYRKFTLTTLPKGIFDLISRAQPYTDENGRWSFLPYLE
jgi:hypothetical protein